MKTVASEIWRSMSIQELEIQYSPSMWSKRFPPGEAQFVHMDLVKKGYQNAVSMIPVEKEIRYGLGEKQTLDLFRRNNKVEEGSPLFVFIHGGYWQLLGKHQGGVCVIPLVEAGCSVALVGYDLAPSVTMKTLIEEIQSGAKFILHLAKKWKSSGVYFCGHSSGGHLISMIAASDWLQSDEEARQLIKGYISISGVFDLRPLVETSVNAVMDMNEEEATCHSPIFMLNTIAGNISKLCQFHVMVGQHDSPEFVRQSTEFAKGLIEHGINTEFYKVPLVDHFDVIEKLDDPTFEVAQKIIRLIQTR